MADERPGTRPDQRSLVSCQTILEHPSESAAEQPVKPNKNSEQIIQIIAVCITTYLMVLSRAYFSQCHCLVSWSCETRTSPAQPRSPVKPSKQSFRQAWYWLICVFSWLACHDMAGTCIYVSASIFLLSWPWSIQSPGFGSAIVGVANVSMMWPIRWPFSAWRLIRQEEAAVEEW